jgi:hypothetical protein
MTSYHYVSYYKLSILKSDSYFFHPRVVNAHPISAFVNIITVTILDKEWTCKYILVLVLKERSYSDRHSPSFYEMRPKSVYGRRCRWKILGHTKKAIHELKSIQWRRIPSIRGVQSNLYALSIWAWAANVTLSLLYPQGTDYRRQLNRRLVGRQSRYGDTAAGQWTTVVRFVASHLRTDWLTELLNRTVVWGPWEGDKKWYEISAFHNSY